MFDRNIETLLLEWKKKDIRKPLIVRGARQVGKTAVIEKFGKAHFKTCVTLNLEKESHCAIFSNVASASELTSAIELLTNQVVSPGKTLLFIDEIQNSANAMTQLRYFYEETPDLHVVAAGSLLEARLKEKGWNIPVGRVEYLMLHPVTFDEFLAANEEIQTLHYLNKLSISDTVIEAAHTVLLKQFFEYALVGGMPEAVAKYNQSKSFQELNAIYDSLLKGMKDDVPKYVSSAKAKYLVHVVEKAPHYSGQTIEYKNLGASVFRSREISEAMDVLEQAMIVTRIHGTPSSQPPFQKNLKKAPKLLFLDSGLVCYKLGLRLELLLNELDAIFKGNFAEQLVGQALLADTDLTSKGLAYWYRNKKGTDAQIDFLVIQNNQTIPIEVKAGTSGTLKSLRQFILESGSKIGFRIYSGPLRVEKLAVHHQPYTLISVPFYLTYRLGHLIKQVMEQTEINPKAI